LHKLLLVIHILGASVWLGGHLILCLRYLPEGLKEKNPAIILAFEKKFEPVGIPALLIQAITGIWLGFIYRINWFQFHLATDLAINLKLLLLFVTILLAIHARLFIIPKLSAKTLPQLAIHIVAVTVIAISMMYIGVSIRFGGI